MAREFTLREASNGGWMVADSTNCGNGMLPNRMLAYSTTDDMLKALSEFLLPSVIVPDGNLNIGPGGLNFVDEGDGA